MLASMLSIAERFCSTASLWASLRAFLRAFFTSCSLGHRGHRDDVHKEEIDWLMAGLVAARAVCGWDSQCPHTRSDGSGSS